MPTGKVELKEGRKASFSLEETNELAKRANLGKHKTRNENRRENIELPDIDMSSKYSIYIRSLRPYAYTIEHGTQGTIVVPACPEGEKYGPAYVLPSVKIFTTPNPFTHMREVRAKDIISGKDIAQSIVNPGDGGFGTDLSEQGVFASYDEFPSDEEVAEARAKLEKWYRGELGEARKKVSQGNLGSLTNTEKEAGAYFKVPDSWNQVAQVYDACPGCGVMLAPNVKVHPCGFVRDWQWAVENGMRKKEDVPVSKRWWDETNEVVIPKPKKAAVAKPEVATEQ